MSLTISPLPTTVIFDCDGVMLQSNTLKSDAFAYVLREYDPDLVSAFVAWHKATGGVSRFRKFEHFFRETLGTSDWHSRTEAACADFGRVVSDGLLTCPPVPGFEALITALQAAGIPMAVNTGGAQEEIRQVLAHRGFSPFFDLILGSPSTKEENMHSLKQAGLLRKGSLYLGDSELDYQLAQMFDLEFIYVSHESEWDTGAVITQATGGRIIQDLSDLLSQHTP